MKKQRKRGMRRWSQQLRKDGAYRLERFKRRVAEARVRSLLVQLHRAVSELKELRSLK